MNHSRKFVLRGKALKIAKRLIKDKYRLEAESQILADKYGFRGCHFAATIRGGLRLISFYGIKILVDPVDDIFAGDEKAMFTPILSTKEGRLVKTEIEKVKKWSQMKLFRHIGFCPDEFVVEGIIYIERSKQYFFYTSQDKAVFQGHKELRELKLSEFYKLIGE